jgi:hypothetical protein
MLSGYMVQSVQEYDKETIQIFETVQSQLSHGHNASSSLNSILLLSFQINHFPRGPYLPFFIFFHTIAVGDFGAWIVSV